jgi:hypothetical protein
MAATLYIIGNGFDLHHGIRSSYRAFGEYLKAREPGTYNVLDRYFDLDSEFWEKFEEQLVDRDTLLDHASNWLVSYGADDWHDAYHHDFQYELGRDVETISRTLRLRFGEWVRQLHVPDASELADDTLLIDRAAIYLNFNYTSSLQRLYGVPDANILHIHGAATDSEAQLVLGHGWKPEEHPDPYRFERDPEAADTRVVEGHRIIDDYFRDTFKPTAQIIRDNAAFFERLSSIVRILVMGHSLFGVDHLYFREVIRNIDADHVTWTVSYFGDLEEKCGRFHELGIAAHLVKFARLSEKAAWAGGDGA